jgi:hypoxanthine-DNA glycosylase
VNSIATGFPPIAAADASILILGSLPSQLSLQKQEYYGNPQNAFWRVMGELFDAGPELPYAERSDRLVRSGIAVWDVLRSSVRPGSMDADIVQTTAIPNDFQAFFHDHPQLRLLCFNGKKSAQLYARLVAAEGIGNIERLEYKTMPSTSPAYAAMRYAGKVRQWSAILEIAGASRRL